MPIKNRKIILVILPITVLAISAAFVQLKNTETKKSVIVIDYGYSVCTMDVPSSSCGPYEVTVQTLGGQKATYKVAGFDNRDREQYDKITSKITDAKEYNKKVELRVNSRGEITTVQ